MELELVDYWQGFTTLIFITITILLGMHFFSRYLKYRDKNLIYAGITWIGISIPFITEAINFVMIILFNSQLDIRVYFLIAIGCLPLVTLSWLILITNLMYKKAQKSILIICFVIYGILEIIFFYLLFNKIEYLGNYISPLNVDFGLFTQIYLLSSIVIFELLGIMFAKNSLKSTYPDIKLKGKFLLTALILFAISATIEVVAPWIVITVIIVRVILILSTFAFYYGFILPNYIKKRFLTVE